MQTASLSGGNKGSGTQLNARCPKKFHRRKHLGFTFDSIIMVSN